jgi:DNA-binding NtrC family response regulator
MHHHMEQDFSLHAEFEYLAMFFLSVSGKWKMARVMKSELIMAHKVMVVDDNEDIFRSLRINFAESGFDTIWRKDGKGAVEAVGNEGLDAVLLDLSLGAENGIDVLSGIQRIRPGLPVIIITGYGTFEAAVMAIKLGAFDFLSKPLDFDKLIAIVNNAIEMHSSHTTISGQDMRLISRSPLIQSLCRRAKRLAATNIPILITGEHGTGKELLAEFIHNNSPRRDKPFIRVNCSAFTDTLVNAELFGHEKGAFTGATQRHIGFFEQANGGSLHLDEIGDMGMPNQAKILRVLEDFRLRRIGGMEDIPVDVRVIASTNKNIEYLITLGEFREDLLYRLNAVLLYLPPLRERTGDLELLVKHFFAEFACGGQHKDFSPAAWALLRQYEWPGNVRELRNLIKVCVAVSDSRTIDVGDLPADFFRQTGKSSRLKEIERDAIAAALVETNGNKSLAASRLGITRRTLYKKLDRYGLS